MKSNWDLDNFFKRKLADTVDETGYREDDWAALEKMMGKDKKPRTILYWLPVLSGVAAVVILALGWWLFKPVANNQQNTQQQITKTPTFNRQQNADGVNKDTGTVKAPALVTVPLAETKPEQAITNNKYVNTLPQLVYVERKADEPIAGTYTQNTAQQTPKEQPAVKTAPVAKAENIAGGGDTTKAILANNTEKLPEQPAANAPDKGMVANAQAKKNNSGSSILGRLQFALTIMGAPDINGVNSFHDNKTGTNVGLLFSASFNKVTVSTGVAYSHKPYYTDFVNYTRDNYTFRTNPTEVLAECRMLDIPLNIDYQIFNKGQNKISVGTGLSSYIMLRENYTYEYADPATRGPRTYNIASPGKYFFGIVNLQATYKRQVNQKVGLSLQPYLKLPLGEVGASKVRLQSAGVALGVSWNINPLKRK